MTQQLLILILIIIIVILFIYKKYFNYTISDSTNTICTQLINNISEKNNENQNNLYIPDNNLSLIVNYLEQEKKIEESESNPIQFSNNNLLNRYIQLNNQNLLQSNPIQPNPNLNLNPFSL